MVLGFKKSLFGYNCDEVNGYISNQNAKHSEITSELNLKISNSLNELTELNEKFEKLLSENEKLKSDIEIYKSKYDEVKTLSDNIGKLYLVAQTNAKAIINAANTAKNAANDEVARNLSAIDSVNSSLNEIKDKLNNVFTDFTTDIDNLNSSLEKAKNVINNSASEQSEYADNFEKIYNQL